MSLKESLIITTVSCLALGISLVAYMQKPGMNAPQSITSPDVGRPVLKYKDFVNYQHEFYGECRGQVRYKYSDYGGKGREWFCYVESVSCSTGYTLDMRVPCGDLRVVNGPNKGIQNEN